MIPPTDDQMFLPDVPHYSKYAIHETPEKYFARLDEEARRDFPVNAKAERMEDDAKFSQVYRTLKELQEERRALLLSLLKHPVASPSGLVGLGIIGLTTMNVVGTTVAVVGEVVNAGVACYVIKRKISDLQERIDRCVHHIDTYQQKYGETAADILSADVDRSVGSLE